MSIRDQRLDRMIEIADQIDARLDDVVRILGECDQSFFDEVSDNPSLLPRYMKSRSRP